MSSHGLVLIGTNLIILAYVHSFVLLTANYDDVKKLAQKFVSESIADTIADFVVKAGRNNIDTRMSNEILHKSRDLLDSESMSDEDKNTNIITKETMSKENMKYKPKTLITKTHITRSQSKFLNASEKKPKKNKEKSKEIEESKVINTGNIKKDDKLSDYSEDSANNNVSVEFTASYLNEKVLDKDLISDQDEEPASDYAFHLKNESKEKIKIDRPATLTTRKKRMEFDQYDNPKYPKAVATSGSVTLQRRLDSQKSRYRNQKLSEKNESS